MGMKISITAVGSRGDIQPHIALGRGLTSAGHEVTLVADQLFETTIRETELDYARLAADPMKPLEADIREIGNNPIKISRWMAHYVDKIGSEYFETYLEGNRGTDLMIFSSLAAMAGLHVGTRLNVPMIATALQPVVRTAAYPYSAGKIFPDWIPFVGLLNRNSYTTSLRFFYRVFYKMINRDREKVLGLPALPWKYYRDIDLSLYPILHGFSQHVIPYPDDYGKNQIFTGYWFLDQVGDWQPTPQLEAFLAVGPKPIYIGFGSMVDREADELTKLVVKAVELSGQRAVLLGGWTDLGGVGLPDSILKIDSVPHDWLFPLVSAVVHHGGAGTTAAGLRAGVPNVVVPFFADQFFWGWRVEKLGAGPKPIQRLKLTSENLAAAIAKAVTDPKIQQQAATLGEKIRSEDGVTTAVRAVEEIIATRRENIMPTPELLGK
jgi:sterol 3beta-glucosyltransferase